MIRQSASTASTSGAGDAAGVLAEPAQPRRLGGEEAGRARGWVFISAEEPSQSRSLVAVEVSPPATGAVEMTARPSSSSARRAIAG